MARILIIALKAYKLLLSPLLPPLCRFYPTCSVYAMGAIRQHGSVKGSWLSLRRILKCHPFHPGGVDMVPEPRQHGHSPSRTLLSNR